MNAISLPLNLHMKHVSSLGSITFQYLENREWCYKKTIMIQFLTSSASRYSVGTSKDIWDNFPSNQMILDNQERDSRARYRCFADLQIQKRRTQVGS